MICSMMLCHQCSIRLNGARLYGLHLHRNQKQTVMCKNLICPHSHHTNQTTRQRERQHHSSRRNMSRMQRSAHDSGVWHHQSAQRGFTCRDGIHRMDRCRTLSRLLVAGACRQQMKHPYIGGAVRQVQRAASFIWLMVNGKHIRWKQS